MPPDLRFRLIADPSGLKPLTDLPTKTTEVEKAFDRLRLQIDKTYIAQKQLAQAKDIIEAFRATGGSAKEVEAALKSAEKAFGTHANAMGGNRMQSLELMHVSKSLFDQMAAGASPFRALMLEGGRLAEILSPQNGGLKGALGQIKGALASLLGPTQLLSGALLGMGVVGIAAIAGWEAAISRMQVALNGLGRSTGLTAAELVNLADSSRGDRVGVSQSRTNVARFAATGALSPEMISKANQSVFQLSLATGTTADESGKMLADALKDPAAGLDEMNKKLNVFSASTKQSIEHFQAIGDLQRAQQIELDAINNLTKNATENTFGLKGAWDDVAGKIATGKDKLAQFLEKYFNPSLKDQITTLKEFIAAGVPIDVDAAKKTLAYLEDVYNQREKINKQKAQEIALTAENTKLSNQAAAITSVANPFAKEKETIEAQVQLLESLKSRAVSDKQFAGDLQKGFDKNTGNPISGLASLNQTLEQLKANEANLLTPLQELRAKFHAELEAIAARTLAEKIAAEQDQQIAQLRAGQIKTVEDETQLQATRNRLLAEANQAMERNLQQSKDNLALSTLTPFEATLKQLQFKYRDLNLQTNPAAVLPDSMKSNPGDALPKGMNKFENSVYIPQKPFSPENPDVQWIYNKLFVEPKLREQRAGVNELYTKYIKSSVDFFKAPGDIMSGKLTPGNPEFFKTAAIDGPMAMLGRMPFSPKGAAGIFGGRLSIPDTTLAQAESLEKQRLTKEEIFNQTGLHRGKDGKWRTEIDDSEADFKHVRPVIDNSLKIGDVFDHPELYKHYPELKDVHFRLHDDPRYNGSFSPSASAISLRNPNVADVNGNFMDSNKMTSTMLHELQHGVQYIESHSPGTSPENPYIEMLSAVMKEKGQKAITPYYIYQREAGEVEARNVQARMDMTARQRAASPPWETQSFPNSRQLLMEDIKAAASAAANNPSYLSNLTKPKDALDLPAGMDKFENIYLPKEDQTKGLSLEDWYKRRGGKVDYKNEPADDTNPYGAFGSQSNSSLQQAFPDVMAKRSAVNPLTIHQDSGVRQSRTTFQGVQSTDINSKAYANDLQADLNNQLQKPLTQINTQIDAQNKLLLVNISTFGKSSQEINRAAEAQKLYSQFAAIGITKQVLINQLGEKGAIAWKNLAAGIEATAKKQADVDELNKKIGETTQLFGDIRSASAGALSTFVQSIRQGKSGLESLRLAAVSVEDKLINGLEDSIVSMFLGKSGQPGGIAGGSIMSVIGGLFGLPSVGNGGSIGDAGGMPHAAFGGTFGAGQMAVVSESGPEIIRAGVGGMSVIPTDKIRGETNTSIHLGNTYVSVQSADAESRRMLMQQLDERDSKMRQWVNQSQPSRDQKAKLLGSRSRGI